MLCEGLESSELVLRGEAPVRFTGLPSLVPVMPYESAARQQLESMFAPLGLLDSAHASQSPVPAT